MVGKAHRFVTALLIPPVAYGTYYITHSTFLSTAAGLGTIAGMFVTPDLDMAENERNILHYPFYFYGKFIGHRSFWSHFPVVGTVGRVLYMILLAWPVWLGFGKPTIHPDWIFMAWMFVGLATSDVAHWCCDGFGIRKPKNVNNKPKPRRKWLNPWLYNQ